MALNNNVVLMCDNCDSVWTDPLRLDWGDSASDEALRRHYGVDDETTMFAERTTTWATQADVRGDHRWRTVLDHLSSQRTGTSSSPPPRD